MQASLGHRAEILKDTGDLEGAMRLLKEQVAICRRLNDPDGLARSSAIRAGAAHGTVEEWGIYTRSHFAARPE